MEVEQQDATTEARDTCTVISCDESSVKMKEEQEEHDRHSVIRFAISDPEYFEIPRMDSYEESERDEIWYSSDELLKIKKNHQRSIKRMEEGGKCSKDSTYRGLELWSMDRVHIYIDTVMDEQYRQWDTKSETSFEDWEEIAVLCRPITEESTNFALKLAKKDAKEAQKAYRSIDACNIDMGDTSGVRISLKKKKLRALEKKRSKESLKKRVKAHP